jgi:tetratricopeptide (TPR) repeat protein
LAVELEFQEFEDGWQGLQSIYQAAYAGDPLDPDILHSWGISATQWATVIGAEFSIELATVAQEKLLAALNLAPMSSRIAYSLGQLYFGQPIREAKRDEAMVWFRKAIEWDASNVMAQLHIGYCLHDGEQWLPAIAAYEKVNLANLDACWPLWRSFKCQEQLAFCYAAAGNSVEAMQRFVALLNTAEGFSADEFEQRVLDFDDLIRAANDFLHDERLSARARHLYSTRQP